MDQSLAVKIQYFHDALMVEIDQLDEFIISGNGLSMDEQLSLHVKKRSIEEIVKRFRELFENVIYVDK